MAKRPTKATAGHNGPCLRRPFLHLSIHSPFDVTSQLCFPPNLCSYRLLTPIFFHPTLPLRTQIASASSMSISTTPEVPETPGTSRAAAASGRTPLGGATGAASLFQPPRTRGTMATAPRVTSVRATLKKLADVLKLHGDTREMVLQVCEVRACPSTT